MKATPPPLLPLILNSQPRRLPNLKHVYRGELRNGYRYMASDTGRKWANRFPVFGFSPKRANLAPLFLGWRVRVSTQIGTSVPSAVAPGFSPGTVGLPLQPVLAHL